MKFPEFHRDRRPIFTVLFRSHKGRDKVYIQKVQADDKEDARHQVLNQYEELNPMILAVYAGQPWLVTDYHSVL